MHSDFDGRCAEVFLAGTTYETRAKMIPEHNYLGTLCVFSICLQYQGTNDSQGLTWMWLDSDVSVCEAEIHCTLNVSRRPFVQENHARFELIAVQMRISTTTPVVAHTCCEEEQYNPAQWIDDWIDHHVSYFILVFVIYSLSSTRWALS